MMGWAVFLIVISILMFIVMSLFVKTFKLLVKAFLVALFFSLIVLGYSQLMPEKEMACAPCPKNITSECVLSLCDCKCYFSGFTPEELGAKEGTPRMCGINCLAEFGVSGCKRIEGKGCVEIKTKL